MFQFEPFTRDSAPMRNSCDVLREYAQDGISNVELVISHPEGGSGDSKFKRRNVYIPYADDVMAVIREIDN